MSAVERVACAWLPDWPIVADGSNPDGARATAVVAGGKVVASSAAARALGVRRGMRLRQATSRAPGLELRERDVEGEIRCFEPVLQYLEQHIAPRWEVIRPGLLVLPARGPARYFGGEQPLADRITEAIAAVGFPVRVGVADTVFAAALAARQGRIVPVGQTARFLAPYPVGVLGRPELAVLLSRMGLPTLGAFAALPGDKVTTRFGMDGTAAHRTARGLEARGLSTGAPGQDLTVADVFEPAGTLLEPVAFAAKELARRLHERLAAAGAVCARIEVAIELASGKRLTRLWRHEGRLSELAVAERVRWQLTAWQETGALTDGGGAAVGIARLALRPEALSAATGRQEPLFGARSVTAEMEAAAARLQAMLGHDAVTRVELGGGRGPAERAIRVAFGDVPPENRLPDGPWPGQLPAPYPAWVPAQPEKARLLDAEGESVAVSARLVLSAPPARLIVKGCRPETVQGWAGPWPALEQWWNAGRARRLVRMQVVTEAGPAWLLVLEQSQWWAEAHYG
ncbi:DNA polymerase Y family protein [Streptomyces niveiscabiei]|uniref:DNA polymerase Y family protein n=1 Tax=Streptomyces niveiscabiei TaxID=164115 RepID=UPI0029A45F41|nr:DNA polymerase Y family protein [Streptomyces niveiscabiei]MDX3386099.1 DNA polymerase Y family protein [Streptomyces niveiscabiei]